MKKIIILVVIIIILFITALGAKSITSHKNETVEEMPTPTIALPTISADVAVDLKAKNDNKIVALEIKNIPSSVESIEYELTYLTGSGLPRGVLGKINTKGENEISRDDIVLGTCSSGKCVYDTGVTSIDLSLKFNSKDGSSAIFQKTYPL